VGDGKTLKVAVVGAGAFGKNHLRVYSELGAEAAVDLCAVVDRDPAVLASAAEKYAIPGFATVAECLALADRWGLRPTPA